MQDKDKTKGQLIKELAALRQQIAELEISKNEHKRNRDVLHANESLHQDLIDVLPAVVFEVDERGNIRFANRRGFEMFGYTPEELEKGLSVLQLVVPEDRDKVEQNIQKIINGEKTTNNEYKALRKDGSTFPVVVYSSPIIVDNRAVGLRGIVVDVTKNKQVENALGESEEKFRTFMETASDLMNITDKDLNLTYVNDSMVRKLGYSKQEMVGMHIARLLRKEDVEKDFKQKTKELIAKGKFNLETTWVAKDGKEIHGELKVVAVYDNDGTFEGTRGVFHDLTEWYKAQQALWQSRERFRSLVEVTSDWIWEIDQNGVYTYASPKVKDLLGYEPEEIIGKKPCDLMLPDEAERIGADTIASQRPFERLEHVNLHKDGRHVVLETSGVPIFDAQEHFLGYRGIDRDVTKRKQVERELYESKLYYRTLFENAPVGIGLATIDGHILAGNQAMYQIIGYSEADIGKIHVRDFYVNPKDHKLLLRRLLRDEPVREFEASMKRKDGTPFDASLTINRLTLGGEDVILTMVRDIAAHKEAERKLLGYQQKLRSLATELSLAEERGRRRIAMYLHDHIGHSLAMCKIKLGLLQKSLPPIHHDGQLEEIKGVIEQVIQGVRSLTSDLSPPVLYEIGLAAAVEWLAENVSKQYGIQVTVKNTRQFKKLDGDLQILLFQSVRELLTNILKHAQAQKVKIYIRKDKENKIRIEVKDDGVGFDTARLTSNITKNGGFGLFNIRERFNNLGGHCDIQSQPGCGTRITIIAPLETMEW